MIEMCFYFSIAATQEIPGEIKNRYEQNGLIIHKVQEGNLLRVLNVAKYQIYIIDDGFCSCDFFAKNERAIEYQRQICMLMQDIYARKIWIQCFLHDFRGQISAERIDPLDKEKISLDEFIRFFPEIQEDVIYQLY